MPGASGVRAPARAADLSIEAELFAAGARCVVGMDEVGRGSLAGPVTVGAAAVLPATTLEVAGLTDSKALAPARRAAMEPLIRAWIPVRTGSASPAEIDALGMTLALRLAGRRALAALAREHDVVPSAVLLDGSHDWLGAPPADLFSLAEEDPLAGYGDAGAPWEGPVRTEVKADFRCASVAAASVVAKVERDRAMERLSARWPAYGWAGNKGYGSAAHRLAVGAHGPSPEHRLSWSLGTTPEGTAAARAARDA
ncbi:ribonuclease HII [Rothia sp. AR01]|uniref:Ribonuclease n=1 Tax=Rothia santali TaxID=2949643 RepID=A0A9X2HME2_9MICC|nr:ribonuclease HII [Rothia santali]MCP3427018.1 ribonuclease HII [Rothia santali]